ncbi:hypothetical protein M407DRAFT_90519 [Tulasnella calospora MUT 4182]|uniref:Uncharacterized protein n=1 Tax=Tulasnella calospora MUT 4182 TaxID=1051891 RepID=A0A0C3QU85_9AGAM|nr:hypothetical protein M407DRAFT_90519 [Tulasnella calospora MUT 4182]
MPTNRVLLYENYVLDYLPESSHLILMNRQQKTPESSSTVFHIPRAGVTPIFRHISPRFGTLFTGVNGHASRIISRLSLLTFRNRTEPKWATEVRGGIEVQDFIVLIFAQYRGWTTTINGREFPLELNAVLNDPKRLLDALGYEHGDTSRRLYFVADFDVTYTDRKGVTRLLPRATLPATGEVAEPTKEGIAAILKEASKNGGSGFVHCGVHCMHELSGTSSIPEDDNEPIHFINTPDGSGSYETFIVGPDGHRIYGQDFLRYLSDLSGRTETTLTLSFDMCNAAAFLVEEVDLPYQYPAPSVDGSHTEPAPAPHSDNQLVVISASQLGQVAGEFGRCGAMTFFLTDTIMNSRTATAADVVQYMRARFQEHPIESRRQLPQIASRYPLTGRFRLLPDHYGVHSML